MRGNIAQMMQQAQRMQENLQRAQEEIAKIEATGSAGGGMVTVTLTGRKECRKGLGALIVSGRMPPAYRTAPLPSTLLDLVLPAGSTLDTPIRPADQ